MWSEDQLQQQQKLSFGQQIPWFRELQMQSLAFALEKGLPNRKHEQWKYTSLAALAQHPYEIATTATQALELTAYRIADTIRLVFVDGVWSETLSDRADLPAGLRCWQPAQMAQENAERMQQWWSAINWKQSGVTALNMALASQGMIMEVAENTVVEKPIHILHVHTEKNALMQHAQMMYHFAKNTKITLFEEHIAIGQPDYYYNAVNVMQLEAHASVHYYKCQRESALATHLSSTQVYQAKHSAWHGYHFTLGAKLARDEIDVQLQGEHARCSLMGCAQTQAKQHSDYHTQVTHVSAHAHSDQRYRAIAADQSHAIFDGKVVVSQRGAGAIAHQQNKNLLLSSQAEIDARPQLEIYTDDVQCSHGSTMGQLDEQALFYLQSRGIKEASAKAMLTHAFIQSLLDELPAGPVAAHLCQFVTERTMQLSSDEER